MIKTNLCRIMERALSTYLALHPDSTFVLAAHEGHALVLTVKPGGTVALQVEKKCLRVLPKATLPVTAHISGAMSDILRVLLRGAEASWMGSGVVVIGDAVWVAEFMRDFSSLELDWAAVLGEYTGDFFAQGIARGVQLWKQNTRPLSRTMREQCQSFLQQEAQILPLRTEVEKWINDIRTLQFDVERLEALMNNITPTSSDRSE